MKTKVVRLYGKENLRPEEFSKQAGLVGAEVTNLSSSKNLEQFLSENFSDAINFRRKENHDRYGANGEKGELEQFKAIILEGKLGVAENGAIWIDDCCFPNRLIPFITEQLVILVPKKNLVSTMHEAYEKIKVLEYSFGVFVSGPSKTADIEQSLVYGAHGAKRLSIIID